MGAQRVELGAEGAELGLQRLDLEDDAPGVVADSLLRERAPDPLHRPRRGLRRAPLPALVLAERDAEQIGHARLREALRIAAAELHASFAQDVRDRSRLTATEREALDS